MNHRNKVILTYITTLSKIDNQPTYITPHFSSDTASIYHDKIIKTSNTKKSLKEQRKEMSKQKVVVATLIKKKKNKKQPHKVSKDRAKKEKNKTESTETKTCR